ncbi:MAG: radical SAM protein [Gallionella sp.]|jgi:7-carboxy-7-deazaguanine synthase
MKIIEIFRCIQGECSLQGEMMAFVRTAGCNLRCAWCDTKYAYKGGRNMPLSRIVAKVRKLRCKWVNITGGEPLIQSEMPALVDALKELDFKVVIFTNGTIDIARLPNVDKFVVDWKLPSAHPKEAFNMVNLNRLSPADELKFVVKDTVDYTVMKDILEGVKIRCKVLVSPALDGKSMKWAKELAEMIAFDNLEVRYSLQIHKVLWGNRRGV